MKIVGNPANQVSGTYLNSAKKPDAQAAAKTDGSGTPTDELAISDRAATLAAARNTYNSLPDVRRSRVADLAARIQSGAYRPDAARAADAMLRHASRTEEIDPGSGNG